MAAITDERVFVVVPGAARSHINVISLLSLPSCRTALFSFFPHLVACLSLLLPRSEARRSVGGKSLGCEPKNVWICGHSLVYWAESRAKSPEVGMQLGMDPSKVTIWWKGTQGMTWSQLLPQLHQLKITWPNPDVLIIHLGGNDLSTESPTNLLASVKKDLSSIRSIFPRCVLVWSNILPRRVWRHSPDSHEVDLVRTTVNRRIQSIVSELSGVSLSHDNIRCGTNTGLYRADGVHLSPKGIDVFNLNLQEFLEKWELEVISEKSSEV